MLRRTMLSAAAVGGALFFSFSLRGVRAADALIKSGAAKSAAKAETAAQPPARELSMQSLPDYRIAPPDVLQIEMLKLVPLPPYRAAVFDVLQIQVANTRPDQPIRDNYMVEADGVIDLGPLYGKVRVAGMTIDEMKQALAKRLKEDLVRPEVSVQLARVVGAQPVSGQYLVGPDGTLNLRKYGAVHVAGKTITEARLALQKHLAQFLDSPEVTVVVTAYNSHVYYLVTEGAGLENRVRRLPITGNETVLDAVSNIANIASLGALLRKKVWVARPAPPGAAETVLPVDLEAIIHRGATATNYQIFPGDRIVVTDEKSKSP